MNYSKVDDQSKDPFDLEKLGILPAFRENFPFDNVENNDTQTSLSRNNPYR